MQASCRLVKLVQRSYTISTTGLRYPLIGAQYGSCGSVLGSERRRMKFVQSSFEQRESIRKARREIFGQFPRLKFGPEGHSMKKELKKRPYGPALSGFQRPHLKDYKFVFHETDVTEDMWQEEQNMKKLGRSVRDGERKKPIREELDVLMKIDQYNDDELIVQEDPEELDQFNSPIVQLRPHSKEAQEVLKRARMEQEDADKRISRDDMASQEAEARQRRRDAAAGAAGGSDAS